MPRGAVTEGVVIEFQVDDENIPFVRDGDLRRESEVLKLLEISHKELLALFKIAAENMYGLLESTFVRYANPPRSNYPDKATFASRLLEFVATQPMLQQFLSLARKLPPIPWNPAVSIFDAVK